MFVNFLDGFDFEVTIGRKPKNSVPCWDQLCGKLDNGHYIQLKRRNIFYATKGTQRIIAHPKLIRPVVIILESPHKEEYKKSGAANGPAWGDTGIRFNQNFQRLINAKDIQSWINTGVHDVILINAVQYQCSFGETINPKLRDHNWTKCFEKGCCSDLIYRLEALQPEILINACTKSNLNLQLAVHSAIFTHINQGKRLFNTYIYGSHPITWSSYTQTLRRKM